MRDQGAGGDMEKLLQERVLSNGQVGRAALYDESDFLCVGSSTKQFNVEPDEVRKVCSPRPHVSALMVGMDLVRGELEARRQDIASDQAPQAREGDGALDNG